MVAILNENKFDLVTKVAHYQRVMNDLGIRKNVPSLRKRRILDKSTEMTMADFGDMTMPNLRNYPISEAIIVSCILEDQSQTLWQLAIRISEYNDRNKHENYRVLKFITTKLVDGFFIYPESYYKSLDSLIHWVPNT